MNSPEGPLVHEKQATQRYNYTSLPYLSTRITQKFKHFHEKLNKVDGALHYKIGRKSANL